jgi:MoaA/NifB/PqqE/SkfB family radical SAM enzyme
MSTNPGPWRITFDTNPDHCNLRCIMCEGFSPYSSVQKDRRNQGKTRRLMDIKLIRKILEEAKETPLREIIPSTMGEPLVYQQFEEIINMCHEFGVKLNLTTNGTFPIKGAKAWAELIVPVTSDVKISWNGATKKTHEEIMKGHNWEKVLDNLKTFIAVRDSYAAQGGNRCRVTLQLTFLQTNVNELADIIKLGIDLGVDRIKGHHLWAHFDEIKDLSMRRNKEAIQQWNEAVKAARTIRDQYPLPNGQHILLENIDILADNAHEDLAPGGSCPFLGQEAWVSAEGRFSPCCAPDEQRKTLGDFGLVTDRSIADIWESEQYKTLQKNYHSHPLCISCNMRKPLKTAA